MKLLTIFFIFYTIIFAQELKLSDVQKEYLIKKKVITVHNEQDWAPYNFNENGVAKGFTVDYMNLIAKKLGIKVKYISGYSWSEFLDLIKENKIDVIANIAKTPQRQEYINFTKPFITSKKAIFSNLPNIRKIFDLNGKTVAVPNKFFIHEYLTKYYPQIKIKVYKNIKECLFAIVNKEVDALIENYAVVNYQIIKNGLSIKYIALTDDEELKTNISIGVAKKEPILRDILQLAEQSITKDEFEDLENKWFGIINQIVLETKGITIYDKLIAPNLTFKEKMFLKNKKNIKICAGPNWMPFEAIDENGNYIGMVSDYAKLLFKKIDISYSIKKVDNFHETVDCLKKGNCDIIMADVATVENKKLFYTTKPYLVSPRAFVTHKDTPWVGDFSYLLKHNNKVGVVANTPAATILKHKYKNINIIEYKDTEHGLKAVSSKEIIAFVNIMPTIAYTMQQNIFYDIKIAGYLDQNIPLSILINRKLPKLLPILNKAIDNITAQERLDIFDNWITVKFERKVDYKYLWQIISLAIGLILIALYINYKLKQKIKKEVEKNKQQQLLMLHQSRLAQMGEMISMIAHQWRQPLNTLSMLNQSVILKYKKNALDDEFIDYFKTHSKTQVHNMSQTIDDFRNFFKPEKNRVEFCVNDIVQDVINMVKPIFESNNIKLEITQKDQYFISGYSNELGQAILNIINNAKDALLENNIENKKINILLQDNENYVILVFQDNAGGIADKFIDKIFDPYFSTKEKNGTGLGLYMTCIIIQDHFLGKLDVKNSHNGAIFTISLPK